MQQQASSAPVVFVVDDDPDVREGLDAVFQSVGLKSQVFRSAAEFLQA